MTITQLSVFIENKSGRINQVTRILADNGINLHAFSMAESADFGILRMIVSDTERAAEVLRAEHFAVSRTEVVCINCPNTPGALATVLDYLAKEKVFIEYMYAFSQGDTASVVIRPTDTRSCVEILGRYKCDLISRSTLYTL